MTRNASDDREHRLPKWAQAELVRLRRTVESLQEELAVSQTPDALSNVFIERGIDTPTALPRNSRIRFQPAGMTAADEDEPGGSLAVHLTTRRGIVQLEVMAVGGGGIAVYPEVSNVVTIASRGL